MEKPGHCHEAAEIAAPLAPGAEGAPPIRTGSPFWPRLTYGFKRYLPTMVLILLLIAVAKHRFSSHVDVDELTSYRSFSEGFVALGTSREHGGILIVSALNPETATIRIVRHSILGYVEVGVRAMGREWTFRVWAPTLFLINEEGLTEAYSLPWDKSAFDAISLALAMGNEGDDGSPPGRSRPLEILRRFLAEQGELQAPERLNDVLEEDKAVATFDGGPPV